MAMKFTKTEALGNDFLLVEEEEIRAGKDRAALARAICHRLRGIGADGLIVFETREGAPCTMKLYNPDGGLAEISGNGLRCLGAYLLFDRRVAEERFQVETDAGTRGLELVESHGPRFVLRSELGTPGLDSRAVPFELNPPVEPVVDVPLDVEEHTFRVTAMNMGNPQCVVFTDRLDFDFLRKFGPRISSHPRFPRGTNVEFVEVQNRGRIKIGIWERGAGETAASGTGSAASVVASVLNGKADEKVTVQCPGGRLEVDWRSGREVYVTGEAAVVAEGSFLQGDDDL